MDYQVYGEYKVDIKYETVGGIVYNHLSIYNIEKEANVFEGGIYPLGYRLRFTGKGYLNGEMIYSNYQLSNEGTQVLELIGANGESEMITFEVSKNQIEFLDVVSRDCDIEVERGEKFSLKFNVKISENCSITRVIINGKEYSDFSYDDKNGILFIPFQPIMDIGTHTYDIERIYYRDDANEYSKMINKKIVINVLKPRLKMNLTNFSESLILYIDCVDFYQTARNFKVVASNYQEEHVYNFPISSNEILLKDLKKDTNYVINVYLVSDINSTALISTPIVTFDVLTTNGEIFLGRTKILKYEDSLEKFCIEVDDEFSKNELKEIAVSNNSIFLNNRSSLKKYIFFCFASFLVGIVLVAVFSLEKKSNKKKK